MFIKATFGNTIITGDGLPKMTYRDLYHEFLTANCAIGTVTFRSHSGAESCVGSFIKYRHETNTPHVRISQKMKTITLTKTEIQRPIPSETVTPENHDSKPIKEATISAPPQERESIISIARRFLDSPDGVGFDNKRGLIEALENAVKTTEFLHSWAESHPAKTYIVDYFEKFPTAPRRDGFCPRSCLANVINAESLTHCAWSCTECWDKPIGYWENKK